MFRSPQGLRSGRKGQTVPLSVAATDRRNKVRSLSTSSDSNITDCRTSTTMPADKVDSSVIETYVMNYLSGDDVFNRLVTKLTDIMTAAVETAVKTALLTVNTELERLRGEVSSLTGKVTNLEDRLSQKTDDLEQYGRRNNLRFFGVEEAAGEDTDELVVGLCERLGVDLPRSAICRSHRVGRPPAPRADGKKISRPLIVRFTSYRDRRRVFGAKKNLKGSGVTIREDLTARRAEVFREAAQRYGIRSTWTMDGRVMWQRKDGTRGTATRLADLDDSRR